jgi:hypothetical protein
MFRGVITLELANVGRLPVVLYPCMRIAQLVIHSIEGHPTVERLPEIDRTQKTKYWNQLPGNVPQLHLDKDIPWIAARSGKLHIGIVGPTKSGKSLLTTLLSEYGFRHFSLAAEVKATARDRGIKSDSVTTLQDLGDELRRKHGNDYLAKKTSEMIRHAWETSTGIVVTGFKHPDELAYFQRDKRFRAIAVDASMARCRELAAREVGGQEMVGEQRELWEALWIRDYESGRPHGQNVAGCMAAAQHRVANETANIADLRDEFLRVIRELEEGQA